MIFKWMHMTLEGARNIDAVPLWIQLFASAFIGGFDNRFLA